MRAVTAFLSFLLLLVASPPAARAAGGSGSAFRAAGGSGSAAGVGGASGGWTPAPTPPFDHAAGVTCDFPIHGEPIVDRVVTRVLATYPDGSVKRDAFKGALVIRVTDTLTGAYYDADASGSAIVDHAPDGTQTWYVVGPVLAGFKAGLGNLPRGLYVINGLYRLVISSTRFVTLTLVRGYTDNVCDHLG